MLKAFLFGSETPLGGSKWGRLSFLGYAKRSQRAFRNDEKNSRATINEPFAFGRQYETQI